MKEFDCIQILAAIVITLLLIMFIVNIENSQENMLAAYKLVIEFDPPNGWTSGEGDFKNTVSSDIALSDEIKYNFLVVQSEFDEITASRAFTQDNFRTIYVRSDEIEYRHAIPGGTEEVPDTKIKKVHSEDGVSDEIRVSGNKKLSFVIEKKNLDATKVDEFLVKDWYLHVFISARIGSGGHISDYSNMTTSHKITAENMIIDRRPSTISGINLTILADGSVQPDTTTYTIGPITTPSLISADNIELNSSTSSYAPYKLISPFHNIENTNLNVKVSGKIKQIFTDPEPSESEIQQQMGRIAQAMMNDTQFDDTNIITTRCAVVYLGNTAVANTYKFLYILIQTATDGAEALGLLDAVATQNLTALLEIDSSLNSNFQHRNDNKNKDYVFQLYEFSPITPVPTGTSGP